MSVRLVCDSCGSPNVVRDAWITWDEETSNWIIEDIFDGAYCKDCEETVDTTWFPIEEKNNG